MPLPPRAGRPPSPSRLAPSCDSVARGSSLRQAFHFQLAHGQPLLWQLGFSTYQWSPSATTAALRRRSNPMPITVPNYNRKTDRLQFGTLIAIPRNPHSRIRISGPTPGLQLYHIGDDGVRADDVSRNFHFEFSDWRWYTRKHGAKGWLRLTGATGAGRLRPSEMPAALLPLSRCIHADRLPVQ